jgi:hypothetical protein
MSNDRRVRPHNKDPNGFSYAASYSQTVQQVAEKQQQQAVASTRAHLPIVPRLNLSSALHASRLLINFQLHPDQFLVSL